MRRWKLIALVAAVAWAAVPVSRAQDARPGPPQDAGEPLTGWQWFEELRLPEPGKAPYFDFVVPPSVFEKAQIGLADLRLRDGQGREVPYALRTRRAEEQREPLQAKEFNRITNKDRSVELSLDLGERAGEHNEIEVVTRGSNFRRRVRLEGSNTDKDWSTLLDNAHVLHFALGPQSADFRRLSYPVSRFRYLRVRVFPDANNDNDRPEVDSVVVFHSVQQPGEYVTLPANLGQREPVRADGGPGSAWSITWNGEATPVERLSFDIADNDFARPYRLEMAEPGQPPQFLAAGEWQRRAGAEHRPMEIRAGEVPVARQLRLVVTDYRNQPLNITAVRSTAAARQVVFARSPDLAAPLRLYFGNPNAQAPRYDFDVNLPPRLDPPPARAELGPVSANPEYRPTPKPLTERWPWLVYVVLSAASLVLLGILGLLAREAVARHDASGPPSEATAGAGGVGDAGPGV
jgi:hypothetical protein